ncbi:MBL fold metallo-hydrolase [Streptomyces violaceusniger]|uniref:MBL fold metallo-hydrolase n=1 Tax=Streptomyces violaceusniger TaxID=68280 RepID=UPI0009C2069F|nr:MBL fold metallo-hydrolase [Streptomyces hygroscopicus]AQW54510.1 beta-lactamase [Streptomyces hygroscopicus]
MELVILGSAGGPQPHPGKAAPATAVVVDGDIHVIDCGNGVGRQIVSAGLELTDLRSVLVTHHHVDHNADLGALVHLAWTAARCEPVDVYGPAPLESMIKQYLELNEPDISHRESLGRPALAGVFRPHEVSGPGTVHEADGVRISAAVATHPPMPSFSYRVDTHGRSVVVSGDTARCDEVVELSRGAGVLVHEAYSPDHLAEFMAGSNTKVERLRQHFARAHTSAEDAGRVAAEAGVRTLVLWHLIPWQLSDEEYAAQAARTFDGEIVVAHDLQRIPV